MNHPERIQPQLFGVDKIIEAMRLEPTKITRNPNALLMQTRHEDKYQLADDIKKDFKEKLKLILGVDRLISWNFHLKA